MKNFRRWSSITEKLWVRVVLISVGILLINSIWFLQPRFSYKFINPPINTSVADYTYRYRGATKTSSGKTYQYSDGNEVITIACDKKTNDYIITTPENSVVSITYSKGQPKITVLSSNYTPTDTDEYLNETHKKLGFEYYLIEQIMQHDSHYLKNWLFFVIINSILITITILLLFVRSKQDSDTRYRSTAVCRILGVITLLLTCLCAFRIIA